MRVRVPAACILVGLGILGTRVSPHDSPSEQARVTAHLTRALEVMAEGAPAGLTASQKAARVETMAWLEEYRDAGRFPHNHVVSGRTPVFVDPHGTPCAVGYLLLRSGEHELVEDIVRTDNLVRIRDLAGEPRLVAWLDARGITLEEAAMIQPAYGRPEGYSHYTSETLGLAIASAAVLSYTAFSEPSVDGIDWPAWLSLGTMAGHTVLLAALLQRDKVSWISPPVGEYSVNGIGAVIGLVVAARRFSRRSELQDGPTVGMAPWVDPRSGNVGVQLAIRR